MSDKDTSDTFRLVEESLRMFAAKIADQIKEINRRVASIQEEVLHLNRRMNSLEENAPVMPPRSLQPSQRLTSSQIRSELRTALEAPFEPEPESPPEFSTGGLAAELQAAEERPATAPRYKATTPRPATVPRYKATTPRPATVPQYKATTPRPATVPQYKATTPRPATTGRITPPPQEPDSDFDEEMELVKPDRGTSRQKDKKDLLDALKVIDSI